MAAAMLPSALCNDVQSVSFSNYTMSRSSSTPATLTGVTQSTSKPTPMSSTTLFDTAHETIVHTVTSCAAADGTSCAIGSTTTKVVSHPTSTVIPAYNKVLGPKISLETAISANVTVEIPTRAVILGGSIAYFPGLCETCGNFRVVFTSSLLVEYVIEACSFEQRNSVVVRIDNEIRYLGCGGDECKRMIICENGKTRFAECIDHECNKNIVYREDKTCKLEICHKNCFQVQECDKVKCEPQKRTHTPAVGVITKTIISLIKVECVECQIKCATCEAPKLIPAHPHKNNTTPHHKPDQPNPPLRTASSTVITDIVKPTQKPHYPDNKGDKNPHHHDNKDKKLPPKPQPPKPHTSPAAHHPDAVAAAGRAAIVPSLLVSVFGLILTF